MISPITKKRKVIEDSDMVAKDSSHNRIMESDSSISAEEPPVEVYGDPRKVLILDIDNPSFCTACHGSLNTNLDEYKIELPDKDPQFLKKKYVWPIDQESNLMSSRAAGDVGRRIALYYPPEDSWYVAKVRNW